MLSLTERSLDLWCSSDSCSLLCVSDVLTGHPPHPFSSRSTSSWFSLQTGPTLRTPVKCMPTKTSKWRKSGSCRTSRHAQRNVSIPTHKDTRLLTLAENTHMYTSTHADIGGSRPRWPPRTRTLLRQNNLPMPWRCAVLTGSLTTKPNYSSGLLPALTANPGTIHAVPSSFSNFWRKILRLMPCLYFFTASFCWWSWPCTILTQDSLDFFFILTVALSVFCHGAVVDGCHLCFLFAPPPPHPQ